MINSAKSDILTMPFISKTYLGDSVYAEFDDNKLILTTYKGVIMSLATWKKEFYPTPASTIKSGKTALKHSLRKWLGLTKENLAKHEVKKDFGGTAIYDIETPKSLEINYETCAMCQVYLIGDVCQKCPLFKVRGCACDDAANEKNKLTPYHYFIEENNPQPMISLLKKAETV